MITLSIEDGVGRRREWPAHHAGTLTLTGQR
jgi:hypothetical protein